MTCAFLAGATRLEENDNGSARHFDKIGMWPRAPLFCEVKVLERVMGIEPTYAAWEAAVLPLNYTRARGALYLAAHRFGKLPFARPLA
jgi:hypothetical protein